MAYCKACGKEIGAPENDLHDPDNLMEIVEGGVSNENAHLKAKDGKHGPRIYCGELGQITKVVDKPPEEGKGEGEEPKEDSEDRPRRRESGKVYDLPEEKSPGEVLAEVVTSPFLGLNESQIQEVRDWAEDYNGQLPPDMLESVLSNMSGVQKQAAALARQKYEVKLNKWVQEQAEADEGPPIGVTAQPQPGRSRSGGGRSGGGEQRRSPQPPPDRRSGSRSGELPSDNLREYRRKRRTKRRNDSLDTFAETTAEKVAQEISGQLAKDFGRYFGLPAKVLESKIEKDPDWVFEKLEQWDIDIDSILEPSEQRKQEIREQMEIEVNTEVDEAVENVRGDAGKQRQPQQPPTEDDFFEDEENNTGEDENESEGMFDELKVADGGGD